MSYLPPEYEYKTMSDNIFRTKFKSKEEIEDWIKKLEESSKCSWSIFKTFDNTGKKCRKNVFKRIYHCHFNTRKKELNSRKRKHYSRNLNCPAQMIIIIKYIPENIDKLKKPSVHRLNKEWPCEIMFKHDHNHTVNSAAALSKRPVSDKIKKEMIDLFNKGHSASSAYHTFCFNKMEELGDRYSLSVADRFFFPKKSDFSNLWQRHFKQLYGEKSGRNMFDQLKLNLSNYNGVCWKLQNVADHNALSFSTPIMQRAAKELVQASEILFVDATGNCDVENHKVYFFATNSPAGGIPLGCIIATSQKAEVFDVAVANLIALLPSEFNPSVVVTDDDLVERIVLQKYFPSAKLLLCILHVLKSVWKWLQMAKNQILKEDRQMLYHLFRNILYSKDEATLEMNIKLFQENYKYENFREYIYTKLDKIDSWCLLYRKDLRIRGTNTNNYVEVMFRLLKDIPLERTKAYNLTQLVDYIAVSFESYYKQRLLDLVMNKMNNSLLRKFMPDEKDVPADSISEVGYLQYAVTSASKELVYFVDMSCSICSCPVGETGKICKHQSAIIKYFNISTACNTLSFDSKKKLYLIATGEEAPEDLLEPLELEGSIPSTSVEEHCAKKDDVSLCTQKLQENHPCELEPLPNIFGVKNEWGLFIQQLDSTVRMHVEDDPVGFIPAMEACMKNYKKNIKTPSNLISALHVAFKNTNLPSTRAYGFRKGKKISVQPTSISRRKTSLTGRRKVQAGRKSRSSKQKSAAKAPHSLTKCVELNISLGDNKSTK